MIDADRDSPSASKAEAAAFATVLHLREDRFVQRLDAWIGRVLRPA